MIRALLPILAALLVAPALADPNPVPAEPVLGTWQNPHHSLAVRTALCGDALCGTIVAANEAALQDARDAGVPQLIGTQLLRAYHKDKGQRWTGTVYVPDMGRSFLSHIELVSPTRLRISGCVLGGWLCKSQEWTRL